jgi:hypothetical protein
MKERKWDGGEGEEREGDMVGEKGERTGGKGKGKEP